MKVLTVLGTRPEIIRLSLVIPKLDKFCNHKVLYTGQNYDPRLSEIFFAELDLRQPDYCLECKAATVMGQIGAILEGCEEIIAREKPDRLLILGDTNSALSAVVAKRMGIPVFHMEAGNRCYDDRVPEEVNRRIIDHCSDILMPYTERSRANLLREGFPGQRIFVTGNPIYEVLEHYSPQIESSRALQDLGVKPGGYFLVTMHRAENVDIEYRLLQYVEAFHRLYGEYGIPVLCSLHPRTRSQLEKRGIRMNGEGIHTFEPLGLFDFVSLEKNALCVLSDSGTVQEECCIFGVPNVTLRDVTERPETVEAGSNLITGCKPDDVTNSVKAVLSEKCAWKQPEEYLVKHVSGTVTKIILSHHFGISGFCS
jgi:UDP-N-acetylglucosamine 2-epimerase (non-hydrolysing)